ncbi:MAG TPA: DUF456 domain-containing protein [Vicinamibacterales bacterium]
MLWALALLLIAVGIIGTVAPAVPGPVLVFAGLLIAAWADGFRNVGPFLLVILGIMTVGAYAIDFGLTALGVRKLGATWWAAVGAAAGLLAAIPFGIPGLVIGPFAGALVAEYLSVRDLASATRAGIGAWIGFVVGTAAKLGIVFAMLGAFAAAYFW